MSDYYQHRFIDYALRCAMISVINCGLSRLIIEYINGEWVDVWDIKMKWIDDQKLQITASVNQGLAFRSTQITSVSFPNRAIDAELLALVDHDIRSWFIGIRNARHQRMHDAMIEANDA